MHAILKHEFRKISFVKAGSVFTLGLLLTLGSFFASAISVWGADITTVFPDVDMWLMGLASPSYIQYIFIYGYLPLCVAFVCNDVFYNEKKNGTLNYLHSRCSVWKILKAKILFFALFSVLFIAVPMLTNWILCWITFPSETQALSNPTLQATYHARYYWIGAYMNDALLYSNPWLFVFTRIIINTLWCLVWSLVAFFGVILGMKNRILILLTPLLSLYGISIVIIAFNIPAPIFFLVSHHTHGLFQYALIGIMASFVLLTLCWLLCRKKSDLLL